MVQWFKIFFSCVLFELVMQLWPSWKSDPHISGINLRPKIWKFSVFYPSEGNFKSLVKLHIKNFWKFLKTNKNIVIHNIKGKDNGGVRIMVFNATFNNISVISWPSVLLVKETGENHRPATNHWQTLSHNVVSSTPCLNRIRTHVSGDRHCLHR